MGEQAPTRWLGQAYHEAWLMDQARRLLDLYQEAAPDPAGGFFLLDDAGRPLAGAPKRLVDTARFTYAFSIGALLGHPGAGALADHGLDYLLDGHGDPRHGGFFTALDPAGGVVDARKLAYDHAHALLAAAAAALAQRPRAPEALARARAACDGPFAPEQGGLGPEEFPPDFSRPAPYRGQNSHMHLVEALLTAFAADGRPGDFQRALAIAVNLIQNTALRLGGRLPEHYRSDWSPDLDYGRDWPTDVYRPYGSLIGHWLEWARLLVQLDLAAHSPPAWLVQAAEQLFRQAVGEGWDREWSGFAYAVDFQGRVVDEDRYWWVVAEAIGASSYLAARTGDPAYERWYQACWDVAARYHLDRRFGGWRPLADRGGRAKHQPWSGKPDLYHTLTACLLPVFEPAPSLAQAAARGRRRSASA